MSPDSPSSRRRPPPGCRLRSRGRTPNRARTGTLNRPPPGWLTPRTASTGQMRRRTEPLAIKVDLPMRVLREEDGWEITLERPALSRAGEASVDAVPDHPELAARI